MTLVLALTAGGLFSLGTYLVLQRKLSRIIIGLALLSHGANVVLLTSGRGGIPPFIGSGAGSGDEDPASFSDPLPQALALTTIVITFGVTALLLALAYRSYLLTRDDEVEDDLIDRALAREAGDLPDKDVEDEILAETIAFVDDLRDTEEEPA